MQWLKAVIVVPDSIQLHSTTLKFAQFLTVAEVQTQSNWFQFQLTLSFEFWIESGAVITPEILLSCTTVGIFRTCFKRQYLYKNFFDHNICLIIFCPSLRNSGMQCDFTNSVIFSYIFSFAVPESQLPKCTKCALECIKYRIKCVKISELSWWGAVVTN